MARRVIVLAAGQGTRMKSGLPKVLHDVAGMPMLGWVLKAVDALSAEQVVVVVGHGADQVAATLPPGTETCLQAEQRGTGHATDLAMAQMEWQDDDTILVLPGDTPLLGGDTLDDLCLAREGAGSAVSLLTAIVDDPTGYGRVIRDGDAVTGIVEHADATEAQRAITEVNAGIYAFRAADLAAELPRLSDDTAQGEYYLPHVVDHLAGRDADISASVADASEIAGVNSQAQLAEAAAQRRARINAEHMANGVWMQDPSRVYIDEGVKLGPGVRLYPGVHLEGRTAVGASTELGPDVFIRDSEIGAGVKAWYAVIRGATLGDGVEVGPYASLRPDSVFEEGAKAGTFVETKNSTVGAGSKVPHLSYVGDAEIGDGVNVGAATVTVNYDGVEKHRTVIEDGAFIGSDSMLVAPVTIGKNAMTAAGSVITTDVPDGALAVERSKVREIPGYGDRIAARRAEKKRKREEG